MCQLLSISSFIAAFFSSKNFCLCDISSGYSRETSALSRTTPAIIIRHISEACAEIKNALFIHEGFLIFQNDYFEERIYLLRVHKFQFNVIL